MVQCAIAKARRRLEASEERRLAYVYLRSNERAQRSGWEAERRSAGGVRLNVGIVGLGILLDNLGINLGIHLNVGIVGLGILLDNLVLLALVLQRLDPRRVVRVLLLIEPQPLERLVDVVLHLPYKEGVDPRLP